MIIPATELLIKSDQFETPKFIFDPLNLRHRFTVDLCATSQNTKCERFYSKANNALEYDWHKEPGWQWCNPPYSKPNLGRFVPRMRMEVAKGAAIVALVPATPGAGWFQEAVLQGHDVIDGGTTPRTEDPWLSGYQLTLAGNGYRVNVRFLKRRIPFEINGDPGEYGAKTDSALISWWPKRFL